MGKPGLQKKKKGPSIHSRAARRGTSPVNTDGTLNDVPAPREAAVQPSVLAARQGAGVSKKTKRKAVTSARARRKHERGVDMAEAVSERTSLKAERSARYGKELRKRGKAWEEVNMALEGVAEREAAVGRNLFAALGGEDDDEGDEEMSGAEGGDAPLRAVVPQMVYGGEAQDEDEEIL